MLNLRPLSSVDNRDGIIPDTCGVHYKNRTGIYVQCTATPIGHLWPSDGYELEQIRILIEAAGGSFPSIQNKFICITHYDQFNQALTAKQSIPPVGSNK